MTRSTTQLGVVPYVFVLAGTAPNELEAFRTLEVRQARSYLTQGVCAWCLQTFLELRDRGLPVALMSEPQTGAVNFLHVRDLWREKPARGRFVVSIQADYAAVPWTTVNIVQNQRQADQSRSFWIPHWPQPGLVPRSEERRGVRCVAYAGNETGLAGSEAEWSWALKACNIEFRFLRCDAWNDYSQIDVLIAVRSFDRSRHTNKPPSKLLNAWHAGIPLVAGYDSAFEQVGRPGADYLRVDTLEGAIHAIRRLRDDPGLYHSLVEAGAERAREYTRDRIGDAWETLLSGPVSRRYVRWQKNKFVAELRERMLYRAWRAARRLRSVARQVSAARP
jgi:Glycosyl transferases group 1